MQYKQELDRQMNINAHMNPNAQHTNTHIHANEPINQPYQEGLNAIGANVLDKNMKRNKQAEYARELQNQIMYANNMNNNNNNNNNNNFQNNNNKSTNMYAPQPPGVNFDMGGNGAVYMDEKAMKRVKQMEYANALRQQQMYANANANAHGDVGNRKNVRFNENVNNLAPDAAADG